MPRLPRCDRPGRWFHVFNRGIARRPVFETRADVRFFLACLARAVRRGEVEIHAYTILTTHFHLLVRSPSGSLAVAMDRALNAYVRYYNRSRRRDGSLFRGRYGARPVDSIAYRRILVRYIDQNAVQACLADRPWAFPFGSAWHYARARRPPWLSTSWVDEIVRCQGHDHPWDGYAKAFGRAWAPAENALVHLRVRAPTHREDALDDLIGAAPPAVRAWLRRKAALADGQPGSLPCVDGRTVRTVLDEERRRGPGWTYRTPKGQARDAWPIAEAFLLRHLAALSGPAIGMLMEVSASMAGTRARQGRRLILEDGDFASHAAALTRKILDRAHGRGE